ncbi:branched-subunit amino acid aminotransferase/4-amino-4-deoxychorismate lyase [Kitasatospora sp. MAA19]|uniref:aminotransferase class IV n=1 Tax=Kitasatospora sp. MAA19 TaxID=3035090 RepID=UPI0024760135|nr:aminotransferase class IV [Kitasatospora sp. MAA19]MDH6707100.1 branched-subunit amino acid aminotransferase/4-amino-4-deoxychorismate lyase [Kitasatospora sp. MAA19]
MFATADGPAVFRLSEHLRRLDRSTRMIRMELPYGTDDLAKATVDLVRADSHRARYLRHFAFPGYGSVGECTGENVFAARDGVLRTPPTSAGALEGITQDTVLTLARGLGLPVRVEGLLRSDLYAADELFVCGTAAGVVPVRSLDDRELPTAPGPVTTRLREAYEAAVSGADPRYRHWLTPVG